MKSYEYRHVVGFEETNLVGNVYYANFISWQGRCREMFLREHAPEVLEMFKDGFAMVTTRVSCDFMDELYAFDEIVIRMRLADLKQNRIGMIFDYFRIRTGGEELVARGEQEIACMQRNEKDLAPARVPENLLKALKSYTEA